MQTYEKLLLANKEWAHKKNLEEPEFFESLLKVQRPDFLWIGCSDSRVPPDVITQTQPGQIFIHRNVANLVIHTDLNVLSVLQYAVEVLKVKHIIVCGHYGCGGVRAAMTRHSFGLINKWLRHIKDIYHLNQAELKAISTDEGRLNRLIELNIIQQVNNLAETSIVQREWQKRDAPQIHGWVYDLSNGIIKPLVEITAGQQLNDDIYQYDNII